MTYRFIIKHNTTEYPCTPLNAGDLSMRWTIIKDDIENGYRTAVSESIVLANTDYQLLKTLESSNFCSLLYFKIQYSCNGTTFSDFKTFPFYITNCEFKDSRCVVLVNLNEVLSCPNKSKTYNLFNSITTRHNIKIYEPNIELETVTYNNTQNFSYDHNYAWAGSGTPSQNLYSVKEHTFVWDNANTLGTNTTVWAREKLIAPCSYTPNNTWTLLADNCPTNKTYVRFASLTNCVYNTIRQSNGDFTTTDYCDAFTNIQNNINATQIPNSITLADALDFFATEICGVNSVKSDFFQINPITTTNINYVTGLPSKVKNITLTDLSDVKRPNAAQKATALNLSFEGLMEILKGMFNVEYRIENNVLIVEHVSYYSKTVTIDATTLPFSKYVDGKNNYKYTNLNVPKFEQWNYLAARYNSDFRRMQFEYDTCVFTTDGKTRTINAVADLILCLSNPDIDSNVVTDDGVFVGACGIDSNNNYYFLTELNSIGTVGIDPNNTLGLPQLLRDYHKYDRPFTYGSLNGTALTFQNVRLKDGDSFRLQLSCSDIMSFSPDGLIETQIGEGEIQEATLKFLDCTLEIKPKY